MSVSGLPFDDFRTLLRDLPGPDARALVAARERDAQLTKPPGALGRLEEIAFWLAAWTGRPPPSTGRWWQSSPATTALPGTASRLFRRP